MKYSIYYIQWYASKTIPYFYIFWRKCFCSCKIISHDILVFLPVSLSTSWKSWVCSLELLSIFLMTKHRNRSLFTAWASISLSQTHAHTRWFLTHAPFSVGPACHAWRTDAHEGANLVFAGHSSGVAVIQPLRALVLVCRERERGVKIICTCMCVCV